MTRVELAVIGLMLCPIRVIADDEGKGGPASLVRVVPPLEGQSDGEQVLPPARSVTPTGADTSNRRRNKAHAHYSEIEAKAVCLAREWAARRVAPARGDDGVVTYVYGGALPSIVCSPLFVCDIMLQAKETVMELHAGDQARWRFSLGHGGNRTHVLVKPTDSGLRTNLIILTDRRTYVVQLVSDTDDWMPRVAFTYPEDIAAQVAAFREEAAKQREAEVLPTGEYIPNLDFGYELRGDSPVWRPLRVYTDGLKTYIQLPREMRSSEAPALVALGPGGVEQVVNYRMAGDRYIVDKVLSRAVLLSGVGGTQQKVEIVRGPAGGRS